MAGDFVQELEASALHVDTEAATLKYRVRGTEYYEVITAGAPVAWKYVEAVAAKSHRTLGAFGGCVQRNIAGQAQLVRI